MKNNDLFLTRNYLTTIRTFREIVELLTNGYLNTIRKNFNRNLQVDFWTKKGYANSSAFVADFFMGGFTLHQFVSVPKDILIEGLKRQKIISKKNLKKILNWIKDDYSKAKELLSDGQGRLLGAILFYINGDFKLEHNCFVIWEGKKYNIKNQKFSSLPQPVKKILLDKVKFKFAIADKNSRDAKQLIDDIISLNRTTPWSKLDIHITPATEFNIALNFDVLEDPIVYDLLQNIVNSYGKTKYKLDARGHLLLFSQLLLWSYKTEAPIDDKVYDIMCNMKTKEVKKWVAYTKNILKFIAKYTNEHTDFRSIESFRNLYMTIDLLTRDKHVVNLGYHCNLKNIFNGVEFVNDLIEDEFNRVSDNDTNYINGQKKNGLDPLGYLFNLAGNSAQNISIRIDFIKKDIKERFPKWEETIIKDIRYISQNLKDKVKAESLGKKDPYRDPQVSETIKPDNLIKGEWHHEITKYDQGLKGQYIPNDENLIWTAKNRQIGRVTRVVRRRKNKKT
jgi:hypothetical protein